MLMPPHKGYTNTRPHNQRQEYRRERGSDSGLTGGEALSRWDLHKVRCWSVQISRGFTHTALLERIHRE